MHSQSHLQSKLVSNTKPPPKLLPSEWAERYRMLSPESCSQPGRWKSYGFQREMMDVVMRPDVHQVTIQSSAQMSKTEILLNICGYFISYLTSPIMIVQPTFSMAEAFSKDRIN